MHQRVPDSSCCPLTVWHWSFELFGSAILIMAKLLVCLAWFGVVRWCLWMIACLKRSLFCSWMVKKIKHLDLTCLRIHSLWWTYWLNARWQQLKAAHSQTHNQFEQCQHVHSFGTLSSVNSHFSSLSHLIEAEWSATQSLRQVQFIRLLYWTFALVEAGFKRHLSE